MLPTLLVKPLSWFLTTKAWRWLGRNILSEWTLRIYGWPEFNGSNYWHIKDAIEKSIAEKGDGIFVFCGVDRKMVSFNLERLLSDVKWGHCGFVFIDPNNAAKPGELSVKHINTDGFVYQPLQDYLSRVDSFYLGRLPVSDLEEAKRRFTLIESLCLSPKDNFDYDYSLELEQDIIEMVCNKNAIIPASLFIRLYCSEFVYLVGKDNVTDAPEFQLHWVGDRFLFEPDDVYRGTEAILVV